MKERGLTYAHPKMAYTIEEAAELLSLSRAQLFRLIDLRELPTIKIGRSRRITYAQLEEFVQKLEQTNGFVRFL